jgi:hypothetical protein
MKCFVTYKPDPPGSRDGPIIRSGLCQDQLLAKQARPGEIVVEGVGRSVTHQVVDGQVVVKKSG